jgi:hypothetical protein
METPDPHYPKFHDGHRSPALPAIATMGGMDETIHPTEPRLFARRRPERIPVDARSVALFRLGEQCNNRCPMCSNSGRPEALYQEADELLARADWLADEGVRRVVVTGGEPTIHPGFWAVVERLGQRGIAWDINTHGRSFADPAFLDRAIRARMGRAIVSFHSHDVQASREISGFSAGAHEETVRGIDNLVARRRRLLLNCVLSTVNLPALPDYLHYCAHRFGTAYVLKLVFPSTGGRGGGWGPIQLRFRDVLEPVRSARELAVDLGLLLAFEGFPSCVLGDLDHEDIGRSGFGETHYLDDLTGRDLYSIQHIEAQHRAFAEGCRGCRALARCAGAERAYLLRYGAAELVPWVDDAEDLGAREAARR